MFEADEVEIRVLVENWVDMLLPAVEDHCVTRWGLIEHFDAKLIPPQAENGISLLVKARRGRSVVSVLFDVGLTGSVLAHNLAVFGEDPTLIDHVVISHGHPDHYGGIDQLLGLVERPVPVMTHPDAFLPRYAVMGDGRTSGFYNRAFSLESVERHGGCPVQSREPVELGWGIRTTGEIPREVEFEGPRAATTTGAPGLYQVSREGSFGLDEVWDEQGLIIDVRGEGIVVLTGCAHAGVVNTVRHAKRLCGDKPIRAVMGGFHLGFPTTPVENVSKTADALRELDVDTIVPMHCSGLRTHASFQETLAEQYVQPAVGTVMHFGGT